MAKSFNSIKAGWKNPNSDTYGGRGKKKDFKDIKAADYDFGVDESRINSFLKNSKEYFDNVESETSSVNFNNAKEKYSSNSDRLQLLRDEARTIRAYYNVNKDKVDTETYKNMVDSLESIDNNALSVLNFYREKADTFSKFKTEDEYNLAVEESKKYYDKWGHYADAEDFETTSANRDFVNPTDEDFSYYDAMMNYDSWRTDASGNLYDAFGNKIPYVADDKGSIIHPMQNDARFSVSDPLGLFLSTPADKRDALVYGGEQKGKKFETLQEGVVNHWELLDEDEISLYYSILNKEGKDKALEYLRDTAESLNSQWGETRAKEILGIDNGFLKTVSAGLLGLEAGLDQWSTGVAQIIKGEALPTSGVQYASAEISNSLDGLGKYAYGATVTVGNMLPSIFASKLLGMAGVGTKLAQGIGSTVLGASAGGNAYGQALKEGYGESQAQTYGVLVGVSEATLQNLIGGIGSLGGVTDELLLAKAKMIDSSLLRLSAKFGIKLGSEIVEEELQNFLEPAFRSILFGEDYDAPTMEEILETAIVTALSTGALEGGGTIATDVYENRQLIGNGQAILASGGVRDLANLTNEVLEESAPDGVKGVEKLSKTVSNRVEKGNRSNNTARKIGRLYESVNDATVKLNQSDIVKSLMRKGFSEKNANTIAEAMIARANGENITPKQSRLLNSYKDDVNVQNAENTILANEYSTVAQRNQRLDTFNRKIALETMKKAFANDKATSETDPLPTEETAIESKFESNPEGKDFNTTSGKIITSKKLVASDKDNMAFEVTYEDGTTEEVDANDINFGNEGEALVYSTVMDMNLPVGIAESLISGYKGNDVNSAGTYVNGMREAFVFGKHNQEADLKNGQYASQLTEEQRNSAFNLGKIYAKDKATADEKAIQGETKPTDTKKKEGKVHFEGDKLSLTSVQDVSIENLDVLTKAIGKDIHIFESYVDENGKRVYKDANGNIKSAPNGFYNQLDGSIWIDLNAGESGEGVMMYTVAHELTHFIKQWSPTKFKALADFIVEQYGKKGESVDALVRKQQAKAKRHGREISYDVAFEEMVADSMESMLTDGKVIRELAKKDKGLFNKIKSWIDNLLRRLNKEYKNYSPESKEGQLIFEAKETFTEVQRLFADALVDASENFAIKGSDKAFVENYLKTQDVVYNLRAAESHQDKLVEKYTSDASVDLETLQNRYAKIIGIWEKLGGELNSKFLNEWNNKVGKDRAFTIFKAQAGYKYNVELSSMCKKGVPLFEAIDTIVKKEVMNELKTKTLGKAEKEILYDILKNHNFEIPCAICYVEQARQREGVIINDFLDGKIEKNAKGKITKYKLGWNDVLNRVEKEMKKNGVDYTFRNVDKSIATDGYVPADIVMNEATQEAFYKALKKVANAEIVRWNREDRKSNQPQRKQITDLKPQTIKAVFKGTLPSNLKIFKVLFNNPSSRFKISRDLLYSSATTLNLANAHNDLYSLFNSQGGVAGYKTKQAPIVYWGDILGKSWKPSTVRKEGGIRNQSNSDFQMYTLLDHAQMYIDFSAKGYYLQAYTKVLAELKLFGLSRGKINASLIPQVIEYKNADGSINWEKTMENAGLDENGNPIYDDFEGINHTEAFMLIEDAEYSKNICGICIGYSDNHIRKLLDDNRIQQIIGFHDKTDNPEKRYRGAKYSKNYNGLNEAVKAKADGTEETVHIGFNQFVSKAEKMFKFNKKTETFEGTVNYNGKEYSATDIPRLAADLYLEMCTEKDYRPAYNDFSSHKNYYKLLADFGLYDSKGNYAPHQKVQYNMPDQVPYLDKNGNKAYMSTEAYIKAELQKELTVRDSISEALADTSENGIIPQFVERVNALHSEKADTTLLSDRDSWNNVESIQGLEGYSVDEVIDITKDHIKSILEEYGEYAEIVAVRPYGSRAKGTAKTDSDLDMVVQYEGDIREDSLFDMLNDEEGKLYIEGIAVDINPIKADDTGDIEDYLGRVYAFDKYSQKTKFSERDYSYDSLVSKPDMTITSVNDKVTYKPTSTIRKTIVNQARKNASSFGKLNENGNVVIHVDDIDTDVILSNKSLTHGLDRRLEVSAPVILNVGSILKNSIRINELTPKKQSAIGSYVLIGYAESTDYAYPVRMVVNQYTNEVDTIDVLYAVNTKKETVGKMPGSHGKTALPTVSNIRIADLLEFVNKHFSDVLPESVLKHYGHTERPKGELGESALYSERDYAPTFYSQMGKVVEGVKQEKLAANSVVNLLRGKGVKAEEIRWSGIVPFLEGKKSITKQELLDFINGSMLQIGEQMSEANFVEIAKQGNNYIVRNKEDGTILDTFYEVGSRSWENDSGDYVESFREIDEFVSREYGKTRWSQYKLDGGSNYREIVFTLSNSSYRNQMMGVHWGDEAEGVLVHARIQDFDVNGKKMLFIEEIQSDWHNEGHKEGYQEDAKFKELQELEEKANVTFYAVEDYSTELTGLAGEYEAVAKTQKGRELLRAKIKAEKELKQAQAQFDSKVPDAPFKENYHEFVLKRLLRMAAEQGYDSIGWTPSDIQSDRWSDEFAEAYRIEYDQEMPKFLRKYGRQWGAKVENTSIPKQAVDGRERILKETELENVKRDIESEKRELARHYDSYEKARIQMSIDSMEKTVASLEKELSASLDIWSMDITDSMKNSVLYEGQVMYSERDTDSVSTRSLLANALEGTALKPEEKNLLQKYKTHIRLIEGEQKKLHEVREKLFTKGVNGEERKKLQFEAKLIATRINSYDKELFKLEAMQPMKNVLTREKELARKRQKQKDAENLKAYKEKVAETTRQLLDKNRQSRERAIEGRNKTEMRHKVKKVVNDLNNLLLKPTKERHIPEEMRVAVAEALAIVNMDTVDADTRVARYNELIAKEKNPDVIASLTESRDRILNQGNKLAEKLGKLKDAYAMINASADDNLKSMYDDVIYNKIESVQKKVGKTPLRNMTLEQLENVYELYKMVLTTVRDSNKAFAEDLKMTRQALGSNAFAEIKENNKARERIRFEGIEKFGWKYLKPMMAMKTIGSGILQKLWNNILYGQEVFAQDYDEAVKFAKEMKEKYGYKEWDLHKLYPFESKSGKVMKINLEQMMSIYAYSKRKQADEHIEEGGVLLNAELIEVKEKDKLGIPRVVKYKINDKNAYRLNKTQVGEIIATLEKEFPGAKDFVDEMQKYLSETMGEKGNEVSMKMYGIKLFKEEHYFPLKSSKDFMEAANDKLKGDVKIKNKGMTKATVEHASNPIVLEGFLDVWGNHVNEMAMYHGLVLPLEDFSRTLNYGFKAEDKLNADAESVKTALGSTFGESAEKYLNELLKAINGGVLHDSSTEFADKMISTFKKSKVMASLSVIVQQPTAIIRAMGIIDPKYFVSQNFHHKQTWEELKKYCPTAIIKETGSFDTNMGRTIVDMVKEDRKLTEKIGDALGKAPAWMDEMGWNMIWRALKKKVATEQNLSGEALLKECGKQMTLIINETQVYDSVMSRNEFMRSKDGLTKMATAFMGEPTTVANMIYGAALDIKRGKVKTASKTVAAVISSVVVNGLVSSLVYALRDDDEEKTWLEKYLSSSTTEVIEGLNPLTYIPFIKDGYSLAQGYDVERTDLALIGDVYEALDDFYNILDPEAYEDMSRKEIAKHIYENSIPLLTSICDMFGLPVGNILRDAKAIILNDNLPMSKTSSEGTVLAVKEGWLNASPKRLEKFFGDEKYHKLYLIANNGDTAYVKNEVAEMVAEKVETIEDEDNPYKIEKKAKQSVKSSFTGVYRDEYKKAFKNKDSKEMNEIRKFLYATGLWNSLRELDNLLAKWREDA